MIRFCQNTKCGRGFVDVYRPKTNDTPPLLCAICRRGGKPLSSLVGGKPRDEAERIERKRERRA